MFAYFVRVAISEFHQLGPELHAASFTLKLGGRCRLHGSPRWIKLDEKGVKSVLPQNRNANIFVEGLDLSKTVILYEGIENIGWFSRFFNRLLFLIFDTC
jgi:hypothetical protein